MHSRLTLGAALLIVLLAAAGARAVSLRDVVELSRSGLSDDVIVALIEVDGTIFSLDAQQLLELKSEGVSDRVLLAMLENGRSIPEPVAPPVPSREAARRAPAPAPFVGSPPFVSAFVGVPVFVSMPHGRPATPARTRRGRRPARTTSGFGRFINDGFRPPGTSNFGRFINDGFRRAATPAPPQGREPGHRVRGGEPGPGRRGQPRGR